MSQETDKEVRTTLYVCQGSALWYGPPRPPTPRCGQGHREINMRLRRRPEIHWRCRRCDSTLSLQEMIDAWKQGRAYRAWQKRADFEAAAEAKTRWDQRFTQPATKLSQDPELSEIQIRNAQADERREEQLGEIYLQWRWAIHADYQPA